MNCGFTLEHYKECIESAKDKGYTIIPIREYQDNKAKVKKVILMRHDVDWSLEYAYELANIEYDLDVRSSYYIYMHSELYNTLSPKSMEMLRQMVGMRHEIGLHTEGTNYLNNERDVLSDITNNLVHSYTFHLPGLRDDIRFSHLLNPQDIEIKYISDSGRHWREGCMCEHIGKEDKLQILTHAEWWCTKSSSRDDGVNKLWQSQLQTLVRNMTDIKQQLAEYARDDIKQ